jgi:hypothetical protein
MFGEITKVEAQDDGTIKVVGVASTGAVDDADETVLPEAMKAALPAYMRFGALREMHGMSAAGATLSAQVGEDGVTRIEAHVVDPLAVKKVQLGVYKGFSITKLRLNEISLVDRPCNPEAVVEMWKADGARAERAGPTNAEVLARATALAEAAGKPGRHTEFVVKARQALLQEQDAADDPDDYADDADPADELPADDAASEADDGMTDLERIQAVHDQMVALGAVCCADNCDNAADAADDDDADKARASDDLAKALAENARLAGLLETATPRIDQMQSTIQALAKRLDELAAQPAAPKAYAGLVRAVTKAEDAHPGVEPAGGLTAEELKKYLDGLPEDERGRLQLRAALREPIHLSPR